MQRNVYFEGDLGDTFVPHIYMECETPSEAFKCLRGNFPEKFSEYMIDKCEKGVTFHIEVAKEELENPLELLMELKEGDMIVTPVPAGSKSGPLKIITAIALVALTYGYGAQLIAAQNAAAAASTTASATASGAVGAAGAAGAAGAVNTTVAMGALVQQTTFMTAMGAALSAGGLGGMMSLMALGMATNLAMAGISQMMAPDPSSDSDQEQSYLFNGAEQNIIEGDPVPLLYGRLRIPGQPIGFEIGGVFGRGGTFQPIADGATRATDLVQEQFATRSDP